MRPLLFAAFLAFSSLLSVSSFAADAADDKPYTELTNAVPTSDPGRIEVVEVFWYGCPHCYHFEPLINPWVAKLPNDVNFQHIPAIFGGAWDAHAQMFLTLDTLGLEPKVRAAVFDAIQKQGKRLTSPQEQADFLASQGVDKDKYLKTYDSFAVKNRLQKDTKLLKDYGITGVPTLIINGKYRVELSQAGGPENALKAADQLIEKERSTAH